MMTFMLILLALGAAALITELVAAEGSPFGYQDEGGFHFGQEGLANADEARTGNPT